MDKNNLVSVTQTAKNPARVVRVINRLAILCMHTVVILTSEGISCGKSVSNFKTFYSPNTEHSLGKICIKLIKSRFTKTNRTAFHNAFNNSARRIASLSDFFNFLIH